MERRNYNVSSGIAEGSGPKDEPDKLTLPPEVEEVFREFRTCEFSTMTKSSVPVAWPLIALWRPEEGRFVLTTSIAMPMKAFNIRRNPKVSLLFSDPTASGIENPPAVLVQGDAEVPDEIHTGAADMEDYWERIFRIQPGGAIYSSNFLMRSLMDMYYMRLHIFVRPRRVLWWPDGDFEKSPRKSEAGNVG